MAELKRIIFEQSQRIKELEKYLEDACKYKNKPLPPKVKNLIELCRRTKYSEQPFDNRIYFKQPFDKRKYWIINQALCHDDEAVRQKVIQKAN